MNTIITHPMLAVLIGIAFASVISFVFWLRKSEIDARDKATLEWQQREFIRRLEEGLKRNPPVTVDLSLFFDLKLAVETVANEIDASWHPGRNHWQVVFEPKPKYDREAKGKWQRISNCPTCRPKNPNQ